MLNKIEIKRSIYIIVFSVVAWFSIDLFPEYSVKYYSSVYFTLSNKVKFSNFDFKVDENWIIKVAKYNPDGYLYGYGLIPSISSIRSNEQSRRLGNRVFMFELKNREDCSLFSIREVSSSSIRGLTSNYRLKKSAKEFQIDTFNSSYQVIIKYWDDTKKLVEYILIPKLSLFFTNEKKCNIFTKENVLSRITLKSS